MIYPPLNIYVQPPQNISLPPSQNLPPFRHSHNLSLPLLYKVTLPETTASFQNIYTALFYNYMRHSQTLPLLSEYTPLFLQCDPTRIYTSLREYTPLFYNYMRPSQNLPFPHRIYPGVEHSIHCLSRCARALPRR